jgi:catechol 2,3-dioxygenase-like lactoylglutathione lyase family enzyme
MSNDQSLKSRPIDQIGMTCTNLEKVEEFYCGVLGLRLAGDVPGVMKFFDCDGVNLVIFRKEKADANSGVHLHVPAEAGAIGGEDCGAEGARREDGKRCIGDPAELEGTRCLDEMFSSSVREFAGAEEPCAV